MCSPTENVAYETMKNAYSPFEDLWIHSGTLTAPTASWSHSGFPI